MQRILIIGSPGSGKSTLGRKLHKITGLPLIYLDMIWHLPDGTHRTEDDFDQRLDQILASPKWIIDGNYSRTLLKRIDQCDTIIYLHYPTSLCLESIRERVGTKREDLPWIEKTLDPEFQDYVCHFYERKENQIDSLLNQARRNGKTVLIFFSRSQTDHWLKKIKYKSA